MWREQAQLYGIDPVKIRIEKQRESQGKKTGQAGTADDQIGAIKAAIQRIIRGDGGAQSRAGGKKPYEGRLVDGEGDLVAYIEDGWEVIRELNGGKVLLRRSTAGGRAPRHPGQ